MLRICRSRDAPATHIAILIPVLVSAVFVPLIGGWCYLQEYMINFTLLQTVYVYLHVRKHTSVKDKKKCPINNLLDDNNIESMSFKFQNFPKSQNLEYLQKYSKNNIISH